MEFYFGVVNMKELITETTLHGIQSYIEAKENVKLKCRIHHVQTRPTGHLPHYDFGYENRRKRREYLSMALPSIEKST